MALLMNNVAWREYMNTIAPWEKDRFTSTENERLIRLEGEIIHQAAKYAATLATGVAIPTVYNNGFVTFVYHDGVTLPPAAIETDKPVYLVTIPEQQWYNALHSVLETFPGSPSRS